VNVVEDERDTGKIVLGGRMNHARHGCSKCCGVFYEEVRKRPGGFLSLAFSADSLTLYPSLDLHLTTATSASFAL